MVIQIAWTVQVGRLRKGLRKSLAAAKWLVRRVQLQGQVAIGAWRRGICR